MHKVTEKTDPCRESKNRPARGDIAHGALCIMNSERWKTLRKPVSEDWLCGWVGTFEDAEKVRKAYEVETSITFVSGKRKPTRKYMLIYEAWRGQSAGLFLICRWEFVMTLCTSRPQIRNRLYVHFEEFLGI